MCSEPVAGALDLDDDGVMQQAVEQCGGHDRVAEHLGPFGESSIGGQDHGAFLVACADQLEEQAGTFFGQRQVADLIDDEQCGPAHLAKFPVQLCAVVCLGQVAEQIGQCGSINTFAGLDGRHAQGAGQEIMLSSALFP